MQLKRWGSDRLSLKAVKLSPISDMLAENWLDNLLFHTPELIVFKGVHLPESYSTSC